ncbi:MAG: biotin/lipoyl-binding protein [Christensenellaceae bacterium]|nr:biotin/lipoyl-binding protein [Christensenellaceae bacterium]
MKYKVTLNGKVFVVEVHEGEAEIIDEGEVKMAATPAPAPVKAEAPAPAKEEIKEEAKAEAQAPVIEGGNKVASPLPGSVVEVLVAPGDTVKEGQPVLIIEAMKMENEIPSPFSGTVGQILVERGRFVNNGDVLMTIV